MQRIKWILLTLSLIIGFTGTFAFAEHFPLPQGGQTTDIRFLPQEMEKQYLAWWGALYPEYCLSGARKLVGEEEGREEIPVKIRFKYLTFLNDCGGNYE